MAGVEPDSPVVRVRKGQAATLTATMKGSDGKAAAMAGATNGRLSVVGSVSDQSPAFTVSGAGVTIGDEQITVTIPVAATADVDPGRYIAELAWEVASVPFGSMLFTVEVTAALPAA